VRRKVPGLFVFARRIGSFAEDERKDEQGLKDAVETIVRLTRREAEVLRLIARGCTYSETAVELGMSAHTVGTHIKNAYRKLDVHCAAAAVMRAIQLRLLETD
jgi:DNA-binding CsgD family transcriptional regulator